MEFVDGIRKIIAEQGYAVLHVAPEEGRFGFSFTIGLSDAKGYELTAVGLPPAPALSLLRGAEQALAKTPWDPDGTATLVVNGQRVLVRPVDPRDFAVPLQAYTLLERPLPAIMLQLLWPCPRGYHPGHPRYSALCSQDIRRLETPAIH